MYTWIDTGNGKVFFCKRTGETRVRFIMRLKKRFTFYELLERAPKVLVDGFDLQGTADRLLTLHKETKN